MTTERFRQEKTHVFFFSTHILNANSVAEAKQFRKALYECERQGNHRLGLCDHSAGVCASIETDRYKEDGDAGS